MCVCLRRRGGTLGTSLNYKANWDVRASTRPREEGPAARLRAAAAAAAAAVKTRRFARVATSVKIVYVCVDASVQS